MGIDFSPLEPQDFFPAGTNSVYLSVKFKYFTPDDNLKVEWIYADAQKNISSQEFSPDVLSSGYHSFNIKIADAFPAGQYRAEVYFNGQLIEVLGFTVE